MIQLTHKDLCCHYVRADSLNSCVEMFVNQVLAIVEQLHMFFIKKVFSPSTETFSTFSQVQYQNFLKTFLAKIFEFHCFAHAH